jgi:tripartite-type tricarboxylate transporter receptor subunit TctC
MLAFAILSCEHRGGKVPERDITNVVVWSAGGGTDICTRIVYAETAGILYIHINVINIKII